MTWPQILMLVWMVFSVVVDIRRCFTDRELSSGTATAAVFVSIALQAGFAYILHAGGFW